MWRWLGLPLLAVMLGWCLGPLCAALLLVVPCLLWWALNGLGSRGARGEAGLDPVGRAVFITGCDTGFGNLLSRRLQRLGFCVFAACLFPEGQGARDLKRDTEEAGGPGKVHIVKLDVCSDEDIAHAKAYVQSHLPEKGLWALVNNAGISTWGNVDWLPLEKYKQVVDVNLIGCIRTTLAFLPLIKQQKGRMVFMSSTAAFMTAKNGIYSMTKAALERFCDSLRIDMHMFEVKVSIIEPGNYAVATNIQPQNSGEDIWNRFSEELKEIYSKEYVVQLANMVNTSIRQGSSNTYEVIDAIVDALTSATPRARYMVANMKEKILVFLFSVCPTSWLDAILLSKLK